MKRLFIPFAFCLSFISAQSFAQEICNNGIDDDGDNFVDCFDNSCATNSICDGFFIGNDSDCQSPPAEFPDFKMEEEWESPNETTNHLNRVSIGDLDRDGIPEVVSINIVTRKIFILNGATGQIKDQVTVDYLIERENIIGNIDNDGCAEIFVYGKAHKDAKEFRIYAYDCNLNLIWRTPDNCMLPGNPYYLSLANFDGDNFVELYYKDEIVDAHTGIRLVESGDNGKGDLHFFSLAAPVAVDMLGDQDLELVSGGRIYSVNLPARTRHSGSLTLARSINSYRIRGSETSTTSVADYNQDGNLDVVMTGSHYTGTNTDITDNRNQNTTVFFWDVTNNVVKTYIDAFPDLVKVFDCKDGNPGAVSEGRFYENGWRNGTGRINLADIDGDGKLNAVYVSGKYLYALDENWNQKWRIVVNEETSGYTGCTMFDFNGDGESEIVYRDEKFVYIIYGNGTISNSQKCISRTNREYPIVADVDGDGSTELCVTCASNDNLSDADFCDQDNVGRQRYSVVRTYRSATEPWVPARKIWNQHGYFNVNVNDDLSIPKRQQKHHVTFYTGPCRPGDPSQPRRPLNSFLNQAPHLDSRGCPVYAAPNIAFVQNSLSVNPPTCPDRDFTISFRITNHGDVALNGKLPIAFYNGDPRVAGATKLDTVLLTLNAFPVGDTLDINNLQIRGPGSQFNLFIVLNDAGTSIPTPIKLPNTNFLECGYADNIVSANVNPLPVPIVGLKVKDNIKCTPTTPDNGAVRAYVNEDGSQNTTDYRFYWSIGGVAKPIPADFQGTQYNARPAGTYTVFAIHKTVGCSSTSDTAIVIDKQRPVNVTIELDDPLTSCAVSNAKLRAVVNDTDGDGQGENPNDFEYIWYLGPQVFVGDTIGVDDELPDLGKGSYSVWVKNKASGCTGFHTYEIKDGPATPVVTTTQVNITCSNLSSGSASASVNGNTSNYTFAWYNGNTVKTNPDFTGATYGSLGAGSYTVVATHAASQCKSSPVRVTITQTVAPVVDATPVADYTSCDSQRPNGSATATVTATPMSTYNFEWFTGQNTLAANRIATTATATGLRAGVYTVKITDTATGCTDTDEVTINSNVVTPTVSIATVASATRCVPPDGSVTASVSLDSPADYKFFWYDGATTTGTPYPAPDTTHILSGLSPGQYTVKAVHRTKHCETAPVTATVNNAIPAVTFTPAAFIEPSDCGKPEGEIEISLSAAGNTSGFDVKWYAGKAPFTQAPILQQTGVTTTRVTNLLAGVYTLVVVNRDNGCEASDDYTLNYLNAHKLEYVSQDKVETCTPNNDGSITVRLLKTPLPGFDESDYDIYVYAGSNDPGPTGTAIQVIGGISGQLLYTTTVPLTPGMYTFVAVSKHASTLDCRSAPVIEELEQDTQDPAFTANPLSPNVNCMGADGTGQITLVITNPADYNFDWYEGDDTTDPALGTNTSGAEGGANGEVAQTLTEGKYTVKVTKAAGASAGCFTTATYQIIDNPTIVTIDLRNDVVLDSVTRCDMPTMGRATVNFVRENNTAVAATNFDFEWYRDSPTGPQLIPGQTTNVLSNLTAGKYYVKPINPTSMCTTSGLVAFEIRDKTMNTVGVDLVSFTVPTQCLKPANITGELEVLATGTSTTGYTYTWHAGQTTAGPVVTTVSGANGEIAQDLAAGWYTIEVRNNSTQCTITDKYELKLDKRPLTITATASPLTVCFDTPKDGSVFAYITSGNKDDYDYNWYFGDAVKANADSVDQHMTNLTFGEYLVVAVDRSDAGCEISALVEVTDERIYPVASAMPLNPLTICDPANPDGVAAASVEGNVVDYSFSWFTDVPPTGSSFYTGAQVSGLAAGDYSVIAANLFTGCSDTTQTTINVMQLPIPMPKIDILSMVTSCVDNNGSLTASVEGNTSDYIFNWYIGDEEKDDPDFTGEIYDSLAVGVYSVTATSRITGCKSPLVSEEIIHAPVYPEFVFNVQPASCDEPNGFAAIFMTNEVPLASIVWTLPDGSTFEGPLLANVPMGTYSVTVTTYLGCAVTKTVEIKTEIHPYNGVSRNGDGKNDIFYINCIESFPTNLVKIFNRAGTLVYEATGYDNIDIYFDGKSNKGVSLMGTNLPDGTYFYIVDKRDGSKPLAGYLEIVN